MLSMAIRSLRCAYIKVSLAPVKSSYPSLVVTSLWPAARAMRGFTRSGARPMPPVLVSETLGRRYQPVVLPLVSLLRSGGGGEYVTTFQSRK